MPTTEQEILPAIATVARLRIGDYVVIAWEDGSLTIRHWEDRWGNDLFSCQAEDVPEFVRFIAPLAV